jgi:nucleobase:cation symporter-1, NCS1 family
VRGPRPGRATFPAGGLVPALKPLYDDNWVVGFAVAQVFYDALTMVSAQSARPARTARHAARSAGLTR